MSAVDHEKRTCLAYARAAASVAAVKAQTLNSVSAEISAATTRNLVELLLTNGCPDVSCVTSSGGTLPRRRGSVGRKDQTLPPFEKLPSTSII